MAKQLNIFVDNRAGRLKSISENLLKSNIDIRAFTIQDKGEYGLLKLLVDKPSEAYLALAELGCACALKDILAIYVPDQPGNFHKLTTALANKGVCCLEIENLAGTNAEEIVTSAGFSVLEDEELYKL